MKHSNTYRYQISIEPEAGALLRVMALLERRRYAVRSMRYGPSETSALVDAEVVVERLGGPPPDTLGAMIEKLYEVQGVHLSFEGAPEVMSA